MTPEERLAPWTLLSSKVVFEHPWSATLVEDEVELPNGARATWLRQADERDGHAVRDVVLVLCRDDAGRTCLIRQWSHALQEVVTELPAGGVDDGEALEDAAVRECREEAGIRPREVRRLGGFRPNARKGGWRGHVFLGTDPVDDPLPCDDTELIEVEWVDEAELDARIADGRLSHPYVLAAILLARTVADPT